MEQKKVKKKQLKKRMLIYISTVLILAMVISTIVGYVYFEKIIREQKISDETVRLQQVANQIQFMTDDIESFARSIIVDELLQEALSKETFVTNYDQVKNKDTIRRRLVFYNTFRSYIGGSFLVLENGDQYSSNNTMEEDYMEKKLKTAEIEKYSHLTDEIYSDPYISLEAGMGEPLVCYRIEMWDKFSFGKQQGTLYLEVYLDYFLKQIRNYGKEYESVCLIGNEQMILYEQDEGGEISRFVSETETENLGGVHKVKEGYLICETVGSTGWKLCTLITNQYLWERSGFVLQFFVISFLVSICLILILTSKIMENMIRPITHLSEQMQQVEYDKLEFGEVVQTGDEIQTLYERYTKMLEEIRSGIKERENYEKQTKKMEFDIMLSQINPHYLYNVLNTVVYLAAAEKKDDVVKIVNSLIYTLQETLNVGEQNIETTIHKELELTEHYLEIQKLRYPNTFSVDIICEELLKSYIVPKTIIQPLVENAILHGLLPADKSGRIEIRITKIENSLNIVVQDDGIGIAEEQLKFFLKGESVVYEYNGRNHIGISNVRDRIRYLYGEPYGMYIGVRKGGGTKVTLCIPLKDSDSE